MKDLINLNEKRAHKEKDSKLWTPRDCALAVLRDIENGEIKPKQLAIHYYEELPDGGRKHHYYVAGVSVEEHISMLEFAKHRVIHDWLVDG